MTPSPEMIGAVARALATEDYGRDIWDELAETEGEADNRIEGPSNSHDLYRNQARAAITAYEAALEAAGFVVVPREPTEDTP